MTRLDLQLLLTAYLIGSIPVARLLVSRYAGQDILKVGSGNPGAMNVFRNVHYKLGLLTVALDVGKALLAVGLARCFGTSAAVPYLAAALVVLGHNYMLFLRFQGGKGLAAAFGALLVLRPWAALFFVAVLVATVLPTRDSRLAGTAAAAVLPLTLWWPGGTLLPLLSGLAMAVVILSKHLSDWFRAVASKS